MREGGEGGRGEGGTDISGIPGERNSGVRFVWSRLGDGGEEGGRTWTAFGACERRARMNSCYVRYWSRAAGPGGKERRTLVPNDDGRVFLDPPFRERRVEGLLVIEYHCGAFEVGSFVACNLFSRFVYLSDCSRERTGVGDNTPSRRPNREPSSRGGW